MNVRIDARVFLWQADNNFGDHVLHVYTRSIFLRRIALGSAVLLAVFGSLAARHSPVRRVVPGVSFRISSSVKIYAGDTPRAQDDEVMRGRGVAADNKARIEFLAFTPAPQGITTDDFVIAVDSGKAFVLHSSSQRFTSADDLFGGPAVVTLGRLMGGGRGGFPAGPGAVVGAGAVALADHALAVAQTHSSTNSTYST
jgi:hypothetical protein